MKISARNQFKGTITALKEGPISAEVELTTEGGDKVVATVTDQSVQRLGLAPGKAVVALVKAPSVFLATGTPEYRFTARNELTGKVSNVVPGAINTRVSVTLPGGAVVGAVVTNEAAVELGLADGVAVTALFKASQVMLGVPA
ncbi:TOBE domain-containing protein [Endothiovibrio diazotrophicus]